MNRTLLVGSATFDFRSTQDFLADFMGVQVRPDHRFVDRVAV